MTLSKLWSFLRVQTLWQMRSLFSLHTESNSQHQPLEGKEMKALPQRLSGVRATEQQLLYCELQLELELLLNGKEVSLRTTLWFFLCNSEMNKNNPFLPRLVALCIHYLLLSNKYPKTLWLKRTIIYYVSWFLWSGIQTEHSKDSLSLLYNVRDLSWKNLKLGTGIIWRWSHMSTGGNAHMWPPHVVQTSLQRGGWIPSIKCSTSKEARWTAYCFYI